MKSDQTGIFYLHAEGQKPLKAFPKEYRRRWQSMFDRRFLGLWAGCAVVMCGIALGLSMRELPQEPSEQEILKIQERYAQLVLDKQKPKQEKKKEKRGPEQREDEPEPEQSKKEKVDPTKESFAEKQQRRQQSAAERRAEREKISEEVGSAGIFAAITSASGSGGGGSTEAASDLLGAADAVSSLEGMPISGGTIVARNVDPAELKKRRGERTSGVDMKRQEVARAETRRIAATGNVNISSEPPSISGDDTQVKTSQACIQSTINRERAKIKRVYEMWLKREPQLGGRIKVAFRIMPNGSVTNVVIVKSTTGSSRFDQNVLRYIGRWSFTKCAPESPLDIELPFVFEGAS